MSTGIELMQHALGINERQRQPYRNYFLAGGDHPDDTEWQKLVERGLAKSSPAPAWSCGDVVYQVADVGQVVAISALPEPKKPTRYDEYLHSEVCESFGEWLGIQLPEYECRIVDRFKGKYEYPRKDDTSRRIVVPYDGFEVKVITHPHFGDKPVKVFAIKVSIGA